MPVSAADAPAPESGEVTLLLERLRRGESEAFDRLFPLVYAELREAAQQLLRLEHPGHSLQPSDLLHEAYLKLAGRANVDWEGRAHFFGVAARAMRQVLVDHARRRNTAKRGGGDRQLAVASEDLSLSAEELLALDDALSRLDALNPRLRQLVEFRFFGGLTEEEAAAVLGVTARTAQRDWAKARAWLYKELYAS